MPRFIGVSLFGMLTLIAALHAYWGLGGLWPASSTQSLIDIVVGMPGMTQMFSREVTFLVAGLIFSAGVVAARRAALFRLGPMWLARLGCTVLALIFLARAAMGYITPWRGIRMSEPFATLDVWVYSPLCAVIGLGFVALLLKPDAPHARYHAPDA